MHFVQDDHVVKTLSSKCTYHTSTDVISEAIPDTFTHKLRRTEITKRFYDWLDGPPGCINSHDVPSPVSRVLESSVILPDKKILETTEAVAKRNWL